MGCVSSTVATSTDATADGESKVKYPLVGDNDIMKRKAHGTSATPVQFDLRWEVDRKKADNICNFNRHYAEASGTFARNKVFKKEMAKAKKNKQSVKFYDSNTGKLLFQAPIGRSHEDFWKESEVHGWPSFRDQEVCWDNMRCLKNGESVSLDGTHLGHNLPDRKGNRYCINLVSVAGNPTETETTVTEAAKNQTEKESDSQ